MIANPKSNIHHLSDEVQWYPVINKVQILTKVHNFIGEGISCWAIRLQRFQLPSNKDGNRLERVFRMRLR